MTPYTLHHGDALGVLATLPDASVDLVVTDPPYYRVKSEAWDRAWGNDAAFLAWLGRVVAELARVLRPNGSLYLFASSRATRGGPTMASRVEAVVAEHMAVLQRVTWRKPPFATKAEMNRKEDQRAYFPVTEAIIFAEHRGADAQAMGGAGYDAKCDELRGFVFEPLRAYLDGERRRSGISAQEIRDGMHARTGARWVLERHAFARSQWELPTREQYEAFRDLLNEREAGGEYLRREYEDLRREYEDLRREYEDLRREYEDLRRPFRVTAEVPYTDVWDYPTVQRYPGKHPCEKPSAMARHMIEASSRPGAVVLDAFCGSGVFVAEAVRLGRVGIGIDSDAGWITRTDERCREAAGAVANVLRFERPARVSAPMPATPAAQLRLFGGAS